MAFEWEWLTVVIKSDQQGTKYVPPLKIPACVIWFTNYLPHIHKATADRNTRPNIMTFFFRVKVADDYRIICIPWASKIRRLAELCFCENDLLFLGRLLSDHLSPFPALSLLQVKQSGPKHKCSFYSTISNSAETSSSLQSWHALADNSQLHSALIYLKS